jgi:hypothetical protein
MTKQLTVCLFLSSLCSLCLGGSTLAALDPELKKPYQLQVVLHYSAHRQLTQVFKDQLKRELRDSLQSQLGPMGQVEVVEEHPLLSQIETRGLQQALDAMEKSKTATPSAVKTHFVLVDIVDGQYELQTSQHDGLTGLGSPIVRKARTEDRAFVAKLAALLVDRDLGMVGTVTKRLDGPRFEVTIKACGLLPPPDPDKKAEPFRWIKKGDVFAIAQVSRAGAGQRALRVPEAFLQVVEPPKEGVCVCRLWNRYGDPASKLADDKSVLGYRCVKLGTGDGPLRLRLVDDKGLPLDGLQVEVGRSGFDRKDDLVYAGTTKSEGLLQTSERYANLAFVLVLDRRDPVARVPVPILEDRVAAIRVNPNVQAEEVSQLVAAKRRLVERLTEALLVQNDLRHELGELMAKSKHDAALEKARGSLRGLQEDIANLGAERVVLTAGVGGLPPKAQFSIADCDQRYRELEKARDELQKFSAELEEIITKLKNDKSAQTTKALMLRGKEALDRADFGEAIRVYEEALLKSNDAKLREEVDELKKGWELKGPEHEKARKFIYEVWPTLDSAQKIKDRLGDAQRAFATCKEVGDKLTPRRLYLANRTLDGRLQKQLKVLRPDNEDDRAVIQVIEKIGPALEKLHAEVVDYLNPKKSNE